MSKKLSRFERFRAQAKAMLEDRPAPEGGPRTRWHRFVHFWVLVWLSFTRNRCPVRASALAYATLLALIPMLAVVVSITGSILKKQGEDRMNDFIGKVVASVTPPAVSTNLPSPNTNSSLATTSARPGPGVSGGLTNQAQNTAEISGAGNNPAAPESPPGGEQRVVSAQKAVAQHIHEFIQNTRTGALGVTGSALLIFAAISMLSRIEDTFNDIWGVARGRSWFMRIVLYWGVLTLAPILLVAALGLATGPHLDTTKRLLATLPLVGNYIVTFGFQLLPVAILCLTFAAFYMLIPNTKVHWTAALVGGLIAGLLFHFNNLVSVLYVSRVVSNSKIYGSMGLVPVFMIGLYFSWLILLFGAQVAYAFQNRRTYAEEKQVENINQRGREFVALRLMTLVGQRYLRGEPPCTVAEMAEGLGVPSRLIQQIMQTLGAARLVVETADPENGYLPSRPIETITCHDLLLALRATQGQELTTRDEPARAEVYGEFHRIQEAERQAATSVTMLALATRAQALEHREPKALQ
jgi:membrane protein